MTVQKGVLKYIETDSDGDKYTSLSFIEILSGGGNTIVLDQMRIGDDYKNAENMLIVPNSTPSRKFTYLMDVLNNNTGITVYWSQVEGTTSDYTIIYEPFQNLEWLFKRIEEFAESDARGYKYTEIKNRKMKILRFPE